MIRPDILESLLRYESKGIPTGDFLRAVLSNNLTEAFGRADDDNRATLFEIVAFAYNDMNAECWGSPEKYVAWLEKHRALREAKDAAGGAS